MRSILAVAVAVLAGCSGYTLPEMAVDSSGQPMLEADFGLLGEVADAKFAWVDGMGSDTARKPSGTAPGAPGGLYAHAGSNATAPAFFCFQVAAVVAGAETAPSDLECVMANMGSAGAEWSPVASATAYRVYGGHAKVK